MKRLFTLLTISLMCITNTFAQMKGEAYINGSIGIDAGIINSSFLNSRETKDLPSQDLINLEIAPSFGYFVSDNFEINASFIYSTNIVKNKKVENSKTTTKSNTNSYNGSIGFNYYAELTDGFYYTPGIKFQGGAKKNDGETIINIGPSLELIKFEVTVSQKFSICLDLFDFNFNYMVQDVYNEQGQIAGKTKMNEYSFKSGKIGFKCYF